MSILRTSTLAAALIAAAGISTSAFAQRVEQSRARVQAEAATARANDAIKDARAASKDAKRAAKTAAKTGDAAAAETARAASVAAEDAKNDAVEAAHEATGLASGTANSAAARDTAMQSTAAATASDQARERANANSRVAVDAATPPPPPMEATVPASTNASENAGVATQYPGAMADQRHMTGAGRFHIDTNVLDVNHDGFLSREEAAANITLNTDFATVDANSDGRIATDELRAWIQSGGLAKNSRPLGDALAGVGSATAFQMLDLDGDGMLTSKEAATQARLGASFRSLDRNRDGKLSQAEYDAWSGSRKP